MGYVLSATACLLVHAFGQPRSDESLQPLCCDTSSHYYMHYMSHTQTLAGTGDSPRKVYASQMLCSHDGHCMTCSSSSFIALLAMDKLLWQHIQCPTCARLLTHLVHCMVKDDVCSCCSCSYVQRRLALCAKQTQHSAGVTGQRRPPCGGLRTPPCSTCVPAPSDLLPGVLWSIHLCAPEPAHSQATLRSLCGAHCNVHCRGRRQ